MNIDYRFIELLQALIRISIHLLDAHGEILLSASVENDSVQSRFLRTCLQDICEAEPKVFQREGVCFGGFCLDGKYLIMGPCTIGGITFDERHRFVKKYGVKGNEIEIPEMSLQDLCNVLALAYYQITGKNITAHQIWRDPVIEEGANFSGITEREQTSYTLGLASGGRRTAYMLERKYYECIKNGNSISEITRMDKSEDVMDNVGKMAKSGIKQFEYLAVETITMSTRAAIEGGMDVESAYRLSDLYLQRLEKCGNQNEMLSLSMQVMNDFSDQVARSRKEKEKSADYVEKCKVYLCRHLREKISMRELAVQIGLNYSYLSRIFSQYAGLSLTEYVRKERLKGAANMLRYTDYTVVEIAEYFTFSSPSRFSESFR